MASEFASLVGEVVSVSLSAKHTFSKETVQSFRLLTGLGVEGDAHMGKTVKHRSEWRKTQLNRTFVRSI